MEYAKANKSEIGQVLFVKWDRFSRNATDAHQMIRRLEGMGIEAQAIQQPIDRSVPEQTLMLSIYVAAPEVENRRRSLAVIRGMRRAQREGRWHTAPPVGYERVPGPGEKTVLAPDTGGAPDEVGQAELVREAFELAARSSRSLEQIRKDLRQKGLRMSRSRFPEMLRNLVYTGRIRIKAWRDEPAEIVEGIHEALVPRELFAQVQRERFAGEDGGRQGKNRTLHEKLPLRGHLLCPECLAAGKKQLLTGSGSKGRSRRYWYYHCSRRHRDCGHRVKAPRANRRFIEYLRGVEVADEVLALYEAILEDVSSTLGERQRRRRKKAEQEGPAPRKAPADRR